MSSAEGFGTEFRGFLFRGTAGIPSEITMCSVYSVFRGIIFLSEIPNPTKRPFYSLSDFDLLLKASREHNFVVIFAYITDLGKSLGVLRPTFVV